MPSASKMNPEDDPEFREMLAEGASPEIVYLAAEKKLSRVAGIRVVRTLFGLNLEAAKEVMVRARGDAASLEKYQGRLLFSFVPAVEFPPVEYLSVPPEAMKARYQFWRFRGDSGERKLPEEREVTLAPALEILAEINRRPPALEALDDRLEIEQSAWISFVQLQPPRALHLYFRGEPDCITYECHRIPNDSLYGLATYDVMKEAVRLFFEGQSPRAFLEEHSLEISDDEI